LVGAYALQVLENSESSRATLKVVTERLRGISASLASTIESRAGRRSLRGLVIAIQGAQPNLSGALAEAANASFRRARRGKGAGRPFSIRPAGDALKTLQTVLETAQHAKFDSVLLVWDEFGRHLEDLLATGRASDLNQLQTIAEFASRSASVPLTVALLTHRGLGQYALAAPQAIRTEWVKVEGRFEAIQYVDDSKEMYRLVAETVEENRSIAPAPDQKRWLAEFGHAIRSLGLFKDLSSTAFKQLLESAFPLHPLALHVLPRIAARISQNERTVFSFLAAQNLGRQVGLAQIYDYFADSMRADTTAGGSHRQYLETETAIRRATSEEDVSALKSACLLGMGLVGERGHVSRDLLAAALTMDGSKQAPNEVIDRLIDNKLLLYRPHSNDVSVWHGADVDLRGVLEAAKERQRSGFRLLDFLRKELPAPTWRPVQFNDDFHIKRYFAGRYLTPVQFNELCQTPSKSDAGSDGADGSILFVLAENASDQERIRQLAKGARLGQAVVVAVPAREASVSEAGLEVACLEQMIRDPELIAKDPLVELELRHLLDDARSYLHRAIDQLVTPQAGGPTFWHQGHIAQPSSSANLRLFLSDVIAQVFPNTPKINNDLINRRKVSAPVANARKKLEMAILERAGIPGLGIQGNFPDASIFRTVLLNTGLYRQSEDGSWRFAMPGEVADPGLRVVWTELQKFFQEPGHSDVKQFHLLFQTLVEPPIGLRSGVLPVLLAAAFRAFPAAISLRREGAYVDDILPTVVEDICRHPSLYSLEVLHLQAEHSQMLDAVRDVFSGFDPGVTQQSDRVRNSYDCLRGWFMSLPPFALSTQQLSSDAIEFRTALRSVSDPVQLLFHELPQLVGRVKGQEATVLRALREEIESALGQTRVQAIKVIRRTLDVGLDRRDSTLAEVCQKWAKCFSTTDLQKAGGLQAAGFINRVEQHYDSDELLLDSLTSLLIGQPTNRWDDGSLLRFDRALADTVRAVEDEAVRLAVNQPNQPMIVNNLARLIEARLRDLAENLIALTGEKRAREALVRLAKTEQEEQANGNNSRSAR
jgi:hypothetical protein